MDRGRPMRGGHYGAPPPPDRRRGRSPSMERMGRGSPPRPHFKRMRGDDLPYDRMPQHRDGPYRGGDRPFDDHFDHGRGYDDRPFPQERFRRDGPPSPPPERRARSPSTPDGHRHKGQGVMGFKAFVLELDDDITPHSAKAAYDKYLLDFWGSERIKVFQQKKGNPKFKAKFDPIKQSEQQEVRNKEANEAAEAFAEQLSSSSLDPTAEDFNQGAGPAAKAMDKEGAADKPASKVFAPAICWKRVGADLKLSCQLIQKLDQEKGIANNVITSVGKPEGPAAPAAAGGEKQEKEEPAAIEEDGVVAEEKGKSAAPVAAEAGAALKEKLSQATEVNMLDLQLAYLWRVHRVNYYVGGEWWDPSDRHRWEQGERLLRAPQPEEGEAPDAEQEKLDATRVKAMVDDIWEARLQSGDPLENLLHKTEMEKELNEWVEQQVVKHEDTKWGSTLSTKMFVAKDFVLKHIKGKHSAKLAEARQQIVERKFFDNWNEFEDNKLRMELEMQPLADDAEVDFDTPAGAKGSGFLPRAANGLARGGSGRGKPPQRGPRPTPGLVMGSGVIGAPGLVGPGGIAQLVLAPGGIEGQGPYVPVAQLPGIDPLGVGGPPMAPRGGRGPRPPGPGGRGGPSRPGRGYGGGFGRGAGYRDLDEPANQRPLLDYGDL